MTGDLTLRTDSVLAVECAVVFACHPVQVMARGWIEHFTLSSGMTRTPRELGWHYGIKPRAEDAAAQANFRKLCVYLKEHPALKVVGIEEAGRLFSAQPAAIERDALVAYTAAVARTGEPAFHPVFSPAELLCGLADSLVAGAAAGDLPESVTRRTVLGPMERPVVAQERDSITADDMLDVCRQIAARVEATGHLPGNATLGSARLGLGQALVLAAKSYLALARYDRYERLGVPCAPRYPQVAYELDGWIRRAVGDHWAMPLDFSCEALAEHARLQTWTMKPAWLTPPQGPVAEGEFAARRVVT